jgi:CDP-paratose 2-epimerase
MKRLLVTGSSGLIGSEVVSWFSTRGWEVHGIDNNMRADFFGPAGDTRWNQRRLSERFPGFRHHEVDIRDRARVDQAVASIRPTAIVHAAAQPSHDLAASRPFDDFDVNAGGTLNLLEAVRHHDPECVFVHLSTNKVYGDRPNTLPLVEHPTRWDYADSGDHAGIREDFPIDQSKHSIFGVSKLAGDVLVQEYGRYFGIPTACLRGGCLTGPNHSGVELHGFLSYLVRCNLEGRTYRIYGYKGKRVRTTSTRLTRTRSWRCRRRGQGRGQGTPRPPAAPLSDSTTSRNCVDAPRKRLRTARSSAGSRGGWSGARARSPTARSSATSIPRSIVANPSGPSRPRYCARPCQTGLNSTATCPS